MKKRLFNTIFVLLLTLTSFAQAPVADFSGSVVSGCAPLGVSFKDLSTGNPKYWDWDFGNGQLSNQQNPGVTFSQPGTYTIKLVVRNANGANGVTKEAYITVFPSPSVSLTADATTACIPAAINFTGTATTTDGSIASYQWDFGDGGTSTVQNPQHTYTETGYYNVSFTATSSTGCVGRTGRNRYIRMVAGIDANFTSTPPAECKPPFNVTFTNESSGPGTLTYLWDFGNGVTSTDKNPVNITYNSNGNFSVKLTTTSSYGCASTVDSTIPVSTFATAMNIPDSACVNQQISFQNASAPGAVFTLWDFGDGTQSADLSPVKTFSATGSYTIKLVSKFADCADSVTKVLKIVKPAADFTSTNNTGCGAPLTVNFQNTTANTTNWRWDFGDGTTSTDQNPQHEYQKPGNYSVTLTVTSATGCEATITKANFVSITPATINISNLTQQGCAPLTINPTAVATSPDGIASYSWNWGDRTPAASGVTPPSHTYSSVGTYTLILTITTNGGCVQQVPRTIRVGIPPTAVDFTATPLSLACSSDSVRFTPITTGATEYLWDFGDGGTSSLSNPAHVFQDTGNIKVTLVAGNNGCWANPVAKPNFITIPAPVAKFGVAVDCNNRLNVTFTDSSLVRASDPVDYSWDFGNGNTSDQKTPGLITYASPGEYTVKLTIKNAGGCESVKIQKIFLNPISHNFTISKDKLCLHEAVSFTALEDSVNIASYNWKVGTASFDRDKVLDTLFSTPGQQDITLTITDKYNCVATSSQSIIVSQPTALFDIGTLVGVCQNSTVTFNDASTADAGITQWLWDYGDGNTETSTAAPFTHQYTAAGSYPVKLTVKDDAGCTAAYTLPTALLVTAPKASFGTNTTMFCPGPQLNLNDSSTGVGLKYLWSLGNGQTSTSKNPLVVYNEGVYTVKLVITDTLGCADSLTRTNYIDVKKPVAAFDIQDTVSVCGLLETKFFAKGQNFESFYWDFGDSTQSTLANPKHFYDVYGNYSAKLFVTGYGGCVDSASHQINVYNPNQATKIVHDAPAFACNQLLVHFNIETPSGTDFSFLFGDGIIDSSRQTVLQHTYTYPNPYTPYVFLTDPTGCQVYVPGAAINIKGPIPVFNIDNKSFCDSGTVYLTNYTNARSDDPVISQVWNFGDGQSSTDLTPPPHKYSTPDEYQVTLAVTTQSNCTQTFTDTVRVLRTPNPVINMDAITCISRQLNFNGALVQADTAITWNWSFGDGRTSTTQNNPITYDKTGNYLVTLTAANSLGCKGTDSLALTVAPLPVITVQNITIPVGGQTLIPVSYSSGIKTYAWSPPDGLNCVNCAVPVAKPVQTATYTINVTDSNTCTSSADITVTVACTAENYFVPNTFSPNGDGMNDVFYPRGRGLARVQSMRIYNRWGSLVFDKRSFTANDPSAGWKGNSAPSDVYVYVIEFVCDNSQIVTFKGNVTLIR